MAFMKLADGDWVLTRGKHMGETLRQVAEDDPSYLRWMFEKVAEDMDDDAFRVLEATMEEFEIDLP